MNRSFNALGWAAAAGLLAAAAPATADVVVLQPVRDNTLFSTGTTSNGAGDAVFSGQTGAGVKQRAVLAFDVAAAVPPGSIITSAGLTLVLVQESGFGVPEVHSLHRVLADWGEGDSSSRGGTGAPAQPGDATWLHRFYADVLWASVGGDFEASVSASQTVGEALGAYTWGSTPQMVADVQAWLDDAASAFGWLVQGNEITLNSAKKSGSKDAIDPALHPRLTIEFAAQPCTWDCGDGDGAVGVADLLALLGQWGTSSSSCDLGLGTPGVGIEDLMDLLAHYGPCP